jgi:hypothetical protein
MKSLHQWKPCTQTRLESPHWKVESWIPSEAFMIPESRTPAGPSRTWSPREGSVQLQTSQPPCPSEPEGLTYVMGERDHGDQGTVLNSSSGTFWELIVKWTISSQAPVVHACNPTYSGCRDKEDHSSKSAPGKSNTLRDPILKKTHHRKRAKSL